MDRPELPADVLARRAQLKAMHEAADQRGDEQPGATAAGLEDAYADNRRLGGLSSAKPR